MEAIKIILWVLIFIVFYAYLGYGILLFIIIKIRRLLGIRKIFTGNEDYEPEVTLLVAAYNEKDYIDAKVKNSFDQSYPKEKIKNVWVTDGSDDGTPELLKKYDGVTVYHKDERAGKIAAMNRGMDFVETPIVIFSDGNTTLGIDAVKEIVKLF